MTIQFLTDSPFSSSVGSRPNPCLLDLVTDSRLYLPPKGLSTLWIPVFDWKYTPNSPCLLSLKASLNVSLVIVFSSIAWVAQSPRNIGIIKYLLWFSPIFSLVRRAWGEIKMTKIVSIIPSLFSAQQLVFWTLFAIAVGWTILQQLASQQMVTFSTLGSKVKNWVFEAEF